ncbi:MAG: lytic transglycosylase domain-containing protein [Candidatus Accumulibacter sp.]|jgi:soluble lytic murein transglycosylase-like protein|nr:lytic transglycosylase domain-containing protein [Accumulibacter sp.]
MNRPSRRKRNARKPVLVALVALAASWTPAPGGAGEVLSVSVEIGERAARPAGAPSAPALHENRLDEMDVYALSPTAARLRLPRMVPPELRRQAAEAVGSFSAAASLPSETAAPDGGANWTAFIRKAARDFDVPPELIAAVIRAESAFQPRAVSPKGARGLMQLMPATGEALGLADPFDPEANIRAGTRYLKAQLSRFSDLRQALAAYNAGPGKVLQYDGVPPFAETREFVRRVLEFREQEKK